MRDVLESPREKDESKSNLHESRVSLRASITVQLNLIN